MDATTGTIYSNLSTDAWRRMVAALVAAIAIQACYRSGLTTRGTTPQRWGPIAVAEFKAREACPEIFPQPVDYTPWEASPKHMAEQIKKWYVRYVHTGGTEPKPRPGRPRTVSDPILKTLVDHVKSVHYDSAAKYEHDAPFQDVLKSHKITFKSLWRSMQHYDPTLQKNLKVEHRPFLSPEQWGDRLDRSAAWLRKLVNPNAPGVKMVSAVEAEREYGVSDGAFPLPPDIGTAEFESDAWLNLTIFNGFAMTDEKTFICNPTDYTAWTAGPRGQSITIEDYRCGSSRPNTIKYIITVCPAFGVVRWEPVAGTSGRAYTPPPELQYQTLAGKDARFITKAEFVKYIGRMLGAFREKAARLAAKQTAAVKAAQKQGRRGKRKPPPPPPVAPIKPYVSWDNPACHGNGEIADFRGVGVTKANFMKLPTYSGDMHCPVEQSHAAVALVMRQFCNARRPTEAGEDPLQPYLDEMEKVVQKVITPQFVRDCMKRMLAHTLPAVLKAGGHWPAKKFR